MTQFSTELVLDTTVMIEVPHHVVVACQALEYTAYANGMVNKIARNEQPTDAHQLYINMMKTIERSKNAPDDIMQQLKVIAEWSNFYHWRARMQSAMRQAALRGILAGITLEQAKTLLEREWAHGEKNPNGPVRSEQQG